MCKQYLTVLPLFILLFFFSCQQDNKTPSTIIAENEMVEIIAQLEIAQAHLKIKSASLDNAYIKSNYQQANFEPIFKKYSITEKEFNNSLKYYAAQPKKMEAIYTKVIVILSEKQAQFH